MREGVCREIIRRLESVPSPSKKDLNRIKLVACRKYGGSMPGNSEIIECLESDERERLLPVLRRKRVRTISGVTVVAVMTKPSPCPKPSPCAYCPGGPSMGVPQSYTGYEPATMRGKQNRYEPYLQVSKRIEQLEAIGHKVDKVELIVMGGTFPATPLDYQESFIKGCLDAITGLKSSSLEEAKRNAETSRLRNVGITVETRPDWAGEREVDHMLSMGVTRVELGVQNVYDDLYELVDRGHSVDDVVEATRILKDSGLKVCYHMMPKLPGSNFERDLEGFRRVFNDPAFRPDMLKIYPTLVIRGTRVYDWWLRGEYEPYTTGEAADLLVKVAGIIPPWVRVMRVQRDIPAGLIVAGVKKSNLRQIVLRRLKDKGLACRCIRCREVGHRMLKEGIEPEAENIRVLRHVYEASEGVELFISVEDPVNDVLIAYIRLRIPSERAHRSEIRFEKASVVRELRVFGPVVPVGEHFDDAWQHKGYGRTLLREAEKVTLEEFDRRKIVVMSALGTKRYYLGLGYDYDGPYVSKRL
ncbi:MAG: tRNA uridine(34) 5-carboxymethylaminomethyl modification radical SAM/GNAT enzyme Elp3 [Candidatus Bathyarchaeota archaeon]|nr:tRNA uridine(34) 5-carboxymethylaminomethyl modification radical SAM/GNAT enzyme Elp3 [Candidatus Bathyarchaeota archaeon]